MFFAPRRRHGAHARRKLSRGNSYRRRITRFETLEHRRVLATYFVDSTNDDTLGFCAADDAAANNNCTLRLAIETAEANAGADTIQIADGVYLIDSALGSFDLFSGQDTTFIGNTSDPAAVVIDGDNQSRVFDLFGTGAIYNISFAGLTIQNGVARDSSGGGGINAGSDVALSLDRVVMLGNTADVFSDPIFGDGPSSGGAIQATGDLSVVDSTFRNNVATDSGGAIHVSNFNENTTRTVNIVSSIFDSNQAGDASVDLGIGGAIFLEASSGDLVATLNSIAVTGNTAGDSGGGVYSFDTGLTVSASNFNNNSALGSDSGGGGLYVFSSDSTGPAFMISGGSFDSNTAVSGAGGFETVDTGGVINGTSFTANQVTGIGSTFDQGGGGIAIVVTDPLTAPLVTITGATIDNNVAPSAGGIAMVNGNVVINDSTISNNRAVGSITAAGGIGSIGDSGVNPLIINRSTIDGNLANGDAGGIGVLNIDLNLSDSVVSNNQAINGRAGGIGILGQDRTPIFKAEASTINNNRSGGDGGGVGLSDAGFDFVNVTISGNETTGGIGGGIVYDNADDSVSTSIAFSTIANNLSPASGANIAAQGTPINISGALFAGGDSVGSPGVFNSLGGNLDQSASMGFSSAGDLSGVDPLLGGLQDNGGLVATHALGVGSPAIDAGPASSLMVDARGVVRPQDGDGNGSMLLDIGAFEAEFVAMPKLTVEDAFIEEASGTVTVVVTLDTAASGPFTVDFMTANGTAISGVDYTATSGTLNFGGSAGEQQTIVIPISNDTVTELDESLSVTLANPSMAVDVSDVALVTISDDDAAVLAVTDASGSENSGSITFTVTLSGAVDRGFTVDVTTIDLPDQAIAGTDYTANAQTLSFAGTDGETQSFVVMVIDDAIDEADEAFAVSLQNVLAGGRDVQISGGASGTIVDDDGPAELDFGDAPNSYPTSLANDGARHSIVPGFFLGTAIDGEPDGPTDGFGFADDFDQPVDDEDGVRFLSSLSPGNGAIIEVTASSAGGLLSGWIDFNRDGDWNDLGEQIITDQSLSAGSNELTFDVPAGISVDCDPSYARFRFSTAAGLTPTGLASDGEVEDYNVQFRSGMFVRSLSSALTAQDLVASLVGSGIGTSNVSYTGSALAAGSFTGGGSILGIDSGVVLSSGSIRDVPGPNCSSGTTTVHDLPGDSDLDSLASEMTNDAAVLEFDFVPSGSAVQFQYVFSSEEYNTFVNSSFNDVFAFFVNGVNYATVNGTDPVSINTINNGNPFGTDPRSNSQLFRNNPLLSEGGTINTEMNGLTVVLTFAAPVTPNQINHIKLAIADVNDLRLDSNVFIRSNSFSVVEMDFGDLPDGPYATLLANDGARHAILPGFHLGAGVDGELDGQPTTDASGDDSDGNDDDDGVILPGNLIIGGTSTAMVTASAAGFLDAWIDFNSDGVFQSVEQIATQMAVAAGTSVLTFTVPTSALPGQTAARFRFSSTGGLSPTGLAATGEVEDYLVTIGGPITPQTVAGHVSCDRNGNGIEDSGEAVAGVTVFLDVNGNRLLESGERTTQTDSNGNYSFAGVSDPTLTVVAQVPLGCQTIPNNPGVIRTELSVGNLARSIVNVDIDGDGDQDLLVAADLGGSVTELINQGGVFSVGQTTVLGDRLQSIAAWMPPNASSPMIAVAGIGTPQSGGAIYQSNGGSQMRRIATGNGPIEVVIADFDGNGQGDVLSASFRSSDLQLLLNGSTTPRTIATARQVRAVAVGDLNLDGNSDIVVGGYGYGGDESAEIVLLLGDGQGGFAAPVVTASIPKLVSVKIVDMDRDPSINQQRLLALSETGQLLVFALTAGALVLETSISVGEGASSFDTGHFNQDGLLDIAIANLGDQQIDLLIGTNDPARRFLPITTLRNVDAPADIVVGNFDGSGTDEIAVANLYQTNGVTQSGSPQYVLPSTATILRVNVAESAVQFSNGVFAQVNFAFQSADPRIRLDVNGDGRVSALDALQVINSLDRNNGEGEWSAAGEPNRRDINGDGRTTALDALLIINHLARATADPQVASDWWDRDDDEKERIAAVDIVLRQLADASALGE